MPPLFFSDLFIKERDLEEGEEGRAIAGISLLYAVNHNRERIELNDTSINRGIVVAFWRN